MPITHAKVSAKTDGGDATLVQPSDWNDDHVGTLDGLSTAFIGASVYHSTTQSTTTSVVAKKDFDSEDFDTDGFHDNSTNNSRLTIPTGMGGKYLVVASIDWASNSTNERYVAIIKNNTTEYATSRITANSTAETAQSVSAVLDLAAGDYVEVQVYQTSGGNLNAGVNSRGRRFSIAKLDSGKVGAGIGAKAYNDGTQSIATGTVTGIALASEEFDTDGFHTTGGSNTRFTIPSGLGGKYLLVGQTMWATPDPSDEVGFRLDGTTLVRTGWTGASAATTNGRVNVVAVADLAAGQYVELVAYQNTGSSKNVGHASARDSVSAVSIMRLDSGSATTIRAGYAEAFLGGPTITNTEDDHFEGSSLDGKWVVYTGYTGTVTVGTINSWVQLATATRLQAVPGGDWTIECELLHGDHVTSGYSSVGLILTSGTTASSATDHRFGIGGENSLANWRVVVDKFINNAFNSTPASFTNQGAGQHHRFLKIKKTSTTYEFFFSDNRFVWTRILSTSSLGYTPTHFGIYSALTASPTVHSLFNYFVRY
jgi:hypothetical protein